MSAENEAYQEGKQLIRRLVAWENDVNQIDASDTQCKAEVLAAIQEAERHLRQALTRLAGIV